MGENVFTVCNATLRWRTCRSVAPWLSDVKKQSAWKYLSSRKTTDDLPIRFVHTPQTFCRASGLFPPTPYRSAILSPYKKSLTRMWGTRVIVFSAAVQREPLLPLESSSCHAASAHAVLLHYIQPSRR